MRDIVRRVLRPIHATRRYLELPAAAKEEHRKDRRGVPTQDPGIERSLDQAVAWLCHAQDNSVSKDGGVARHFSLVSGWGSSYPETTGYIVPTLLEYAKLRGDEALRRRVKRMLDWLVSIQLPGGGFQGGVIGSRPVVPVIFNTGQVLLGLAAGVREFGETYRQALRHAAQWLVDTQDPDGCWRKYPSPFAMPGEKAYETHVAWGLLEAARVERNTAYATAALASVKWALHSQKANGWVDNCCLSNPCQPFTHTLGYFLRGIIEASRYTGDESYLRAARRTADGLLTAVREDGFLPGRLNSSWQGTVSWACLTGSLQIAHCAFMLHQDTGEVRYRRAACAMNQYVRRTIKLKGPLEARGGIKGSFPVYGEYCPYEYLNWASKFFIDSHVMERAIRKQEQLTPLTP
jgi:rhamnogalacturonyl hydrolase YesR